MALLGSILHCSCNYLVWEVGEWKGGKLRKGKKEERIEGKHLTPIYAQGIQKRTSQGIRVELP